MFASLHSIPIRIHPFFWIIILVIGWINSFTILGTVIWGIVILVSVLIHEFGHALTALYFGQDAEISLMGLGGLTQRRGPSLKGWQEFLVVLNGPLAGLSLCAVAFGTRASFGGAGPSIILYALNIMVYVNLVWTLINLLPIQPLDGGHLLKIFLEGLFGRWGVQCAYFISMVLAGALALLCFFLQFLLASALCVLFAYESYRKFSGAWHGI